MKQLLLLFALLLFSITSQAQLTNVIDGLVSPVGLTLNNNELYISDVGAQRIIKIDLSQPTPVVEDVLTNVSFATEMVIIGDELYFTSLSLGGLAKINLTDTNPVIEMVVSGLSNPFGLVRNGHDMYMSLRMDGIIVKVDISQTNPTVETVVSGLGTFLNGMDLNGNDLYITRGNDAIVSKINITDTNPVVENIVFGYTAQDVEVSGDFLYIASTGKISRFDLTQEFASPTDLVTNTTTPWGLKVVGTDLYAAQQTAGQVSKLDLSVYDDPTQSPDYNALIDLYNATNGNSWTNNENWANVNEPLERWHGIRMSNNRVIGLDLVSNNMDGQIPTSISDLTEIENLLLLQNDISGDIPNEIWTLTNLKWLWLGSQSSDLLELPNNQIPNSIANLQSLEWLNLNSIDLNIPLEPELFNLPNLSTLRLSDCGLTGTLPIEFANIDNLRISGNEFVGPIPSEFINSSGNTLLSISNNFFDFSDLEPLVSAAPYTVLEYSPQRPQDTQDNITTGTGVNIDLDVNDTGLNRNAQDSAMNNEYQWFKDGQPISGANANTYTIINAQESDSGVYFCQITNTILPDLVINRADIIIVVDDALSVGDTQIEKLEIYPNPVKEWLNIDFKSSNKQIVSIMDINGKIILATEKQSDVLALDVSKLSNGLYIINIRSEGQYYTQKFIKE